MSAREGCALRRICLALLIIALPVGVAPLAQAELLNPAAFTSLGTLAPVPGVVVVDSSDPPTMVGTGVNFVGVIENGVAVFCFDSITLVTGTALLVQQGENPVALLSKGPIIIQAGAFIDASAGAVSARNPGAGGKAGGSGVTTYQLGTIGNNGQGDISGSFVGAGGGAFDGGGGGGFGGAGGQGAGPGGLFGFGNGSGGTVNGDLKTLLTGGGGGGAGGPGTNNTPAIGSDGGGGGGAVEIGALDAISLLGIIRANGAAGSPSVPTAGSGGGGAGGGVLIHGKSLQFTGSIEAKGGNGGAGVGFDGGGGGGGGRVVIALPGAGGVSADQLTQINVQGGAAGNADASAGSVGIITLDNADKDNDGLCDPADPPALRLLCTGNDLCPDTTPAAPIDVNGCSAAQVDSDNDSICNPGAPSPGPDNCVGSDNCPGVANQPQLDTDADGVGDGCDNCVAVANPTQIDSDADGTGDLCEQCPLDPNKLEPGTCGCGQEDTPNCGDLCPSDPNKTAPGTCGCGVSDVDSDTDQVADCLDNCDLALNPDQADGDADGTGDACDLCPADPNKVQAGACGCGVADTDANQDGVPDCFTIDQCPNDASKTTPGICGCGVADTDGDGDGMPNCLDECPADSAKVVPGACGCGNAETADCGGGAPGGCGAGAGLFAPFAALGFCGMRLYRRRP